METTIHKEHKIKRYLVIQTIALSFLIFLLNSCEDNLSVDIPTDKIVIDEAFSDDINATSAILGIYHDLVRESFANSSTTYGAMMFMGLSADEFLANQNRASLINFQENELNSESSEVYQLWRTPYYIIYQCNLALENLDFSGKISESVRNQLKGEALFIRAFSYFYLINLFGDVPLAITTDYKVNASIGRSTVKQVYAQILADLKESKELLTNDYLDASYGDTSKKLRVNKWAATALLSRVYLYNEEWENAEIATSEVIESGKYSLENDFSKIFLSNSSEAIWQMMPLELSTGPYTNEARYGIITSGSSYYYSLRHEFVDNFSEADLRKEHWIGLYKSGNSELFYPYKYKIKSGDSEEYSTALRLAELHLIRAEARTHLNKINLAIEDVDLIRDRAGMELIKNTTPTITQSDLLLVIENERRCELFAEFGHRFMDLKRTGRVDQVLGTLKSTWDSFDRLYPIPQLEIAKNPHLGTQNPGY